MADQGNKWKSSGPPAGFKASEPPPEFSVPGAPEGLPSAGAAETIANIIPESEAAQRIRTTVPNVTADPRTGAAQEQEKRLNAYDPGGQMVGATSAVGIPGIVKGLATSPLATGRGLLRVGGGIATGRMIGGALGFPRLGSLAGGLLAGSTLRTPEVAPEVADVATSPGPYRGPSSVPKVEPELGSPENPGFYAKLPTRMPTPATPEEAVSPIDESRLARRYIAGTKYPTRLGPEPPPGLGSQTQAGASQQTGTQGGGGPVSLVPEPRPALAADRPGANWSTPREELPGRALRGEPGAADVLRQTQEAPVLYAPRGAGVSGTSPSELEAIRGRSGLFGQSESGGGGSAAPGPISRIETDSLGIRWAVAPDGNRVSIPRNIPEAEVANYAAPKLQEQRQVRGGLFGTP